MVSAKEEKEVWVNAGRGDVYVQEEDHQGRVVAKHVGPGQKFNISSRDRLVHNSDLAYSSDADLFANGVLSRVRLVDTAEDYESLKDNPNLLSDDDLREILKLNATQFKKKLAEINNVRILNRLEELSQEDELNVSVPQVKALTAKLDEIAPERNQLPVFRDYTDGKPIPVQDLS